MANMNVLSAERVDAAVHGASPDLMDGGSHGDFMDGYLNLWHSLQTMGAPEAAAPVEAVDPTQVAEDAGAAAVRFNCMLEDM